MAHIHLVLIINSQIFLKLIKLQARNLENTVIGRAYEPSQNYTYIGLVVTAVSHYRELVCSVFY